MMRKFYSHMYYLFYKLGEMSNSVFSSGFVAGICILALEIWICFSFLNYIDYFFDLYQLIENYDIYVFGGLFVFILLIDIYYRDTKVNKLIMLREVRENPRKKRDLGIAVFIVLSIVANLIFSFYLIKMKYKGY